MVRSHLHLKTALVCLFLGVFPLAACGAPVIGLSETAPPPSPTRSILPTPTAAFNEFETDYLPDELREHLLMFTATPTPVTPVRPSPTAELIPSPLSNEGPWLVLPQDGLMRNAAPQYFAMNIDGSGLQPLPLPELPADREWAFLSEPNGPFIAFRTLPVNTGFVDLRADGLDDYVWIVKLPENRLIRQIQLIGDQAWEVIAQVREAAENEYYANYEIATQLGLPANPDSFQWSPRGRYLSYTAAVNGQAADLYLYDTQTDTIRRLTSGRTGAQVWDWSPDGSTVFYRNGLLTVTEYFYPDLAYMDGVYALNLLSGERRLYDPDHWERIAGMTGEYFLVHNQYFEADPTDLRLVNYQTGSVKLIYSGPFTDTAMDANGENILVLFNPNRAFGGEFEGITPGIYKYNPNTGQLDFLREGVWLVEYLDEVSLFSTYQQKNADTKDFVFFEPTGQEVILITGVLSPKTSPDGQWIIIETSDAQMLYSISGVQVKELNKGNVRWFPDSSGFYLITCSNIQLFTQENDWRGETLASFACDQIYLVPPAQ